MKKVILSISFIVLLTAFGTSMLVRDKKLDEANNNTAYIENIEEDNIALENQFEGAVEILNSDIDKKEEVFYCTDTGKKYHRANCQYLCYSKNEIHNEEIEHKCLKPCKICIGY